MAVDDSQRVDRLAARLGGDAADPGAVRWLLGAGACTALVFGLLTRLVAGRELFWRSLVARTRRPLRLAI